MIIPVSVCHHVSTIGQRLAADVLVVPDPRLGVDRLADRAEQPQRREVVLAARAPAPTSCASGSPSARCRGSSRRSARRSPTSGPCRGSRACPRTCTRRGAVAERAVDDVAVAGHPADVGGAPVDVGVGLQVEDVVVRRRDADEVAGGRVRDPLRLRGRAATCRAGRADPRRPSARPGSRVSSVASSCHQWSRPSVIGTSLPVRRSDDARA